MGGGGGGSPSTNQSQSQAAAAAAAQAKAEAEAKEAAAKAAAEAKQNAYNAAKNNALNSYTNNRTSGNLGSGSAMQSQASRIRVGLSSSYKEGQNAKAQQAERLSLLSIIAPDMLDKTLGGNNSLGG